ncbi:MAG: TonB-dependent receptor [Cyclobacteriaceae bacterium]
MISSNDSVVYRISPLLKRFLIILICGIYLTIPQAKAQDYSQVLINEQFMGLTLHRILDKIALKYQVTFDYKEEDLPNKLLSGKTYTNKPLSVVLDQLLEGYDVQYKIQSTGNVIIRSSDAGEDIEEQIVKEFHLDATPTRFDFTLKGKIIDQASGETLPFASVGMRYGSSGTSTNVDGYFTLTDLETDTASLAIQYIGYQTKYVKLYPEMISTDFTTFELVSNTTQLKEVVISDKKEHMMKASSDISTISLAPAQLAGLPSLGEKDIFRSLQMLPGVSGTNETSAGLFVRGGTPDQNLILFDGFTVYHVDHFYGFFSAFNANAVKDIQFYKGGFEAAYGGRLSSVVSLTGKNGNTNQLSGNFGMSALSVNGSLEGPIAQGKGSFFVSARRSYTDIIRSGLYGDIFDLFAEEDGGNAPVGTGGPRGGRFAQVQNEPAFYFYDLNGKLTYRPTTKDILSFSIYNGEDNLDNSSDFDSNDLQGIPGGGDNGGFNNNTIDLNDWGNVGTSLKWGRQWNDRLFSNTVLSYSNYFINRERYSETEITRQDSTFSRRTGVFEDNDVIDLTLRSDYELTLNQQHEVGFGLQITHNQVSYLQLQNDTTEVLNREDQGQTYAMYLQDTWQPSERLVIKPGVRLTYYSETADTYIEPRLSMSYQLAPRIKAKVAWGTHNQYITSVVREDISQGSRDFWLMANDDVNPVSSATHYVVGASYETDAFLFDVEAYYKDMSGLSEYTLRLTNNFNRSTEVSELFYQGTGYSKGLEFLIQKKFGSYTGWIGYTLSETIHEFPELANNPYPALQDQTHEFKSVNSLRLGRWTLSGTWVYATGKPYTSPIGGYEVTLLDGTENSYVSVGEKNSLRLAPYHRMDVSATYGWDWGKKAKAELGVSVFNFYNNTNTWYKTFEVIEGDMIVTDVNTIGFTPNIFFNIKF